MIIHEPELKEENAQTFAEYITNVFQPLSFKVFSEEDHITFYLKAPYQMALPIKLFLFAKIKTKKYNLKTASVFD